MDIATIIGLFGGTGLVVAAVIFGGSAVIFFNVPGLLIVFGGTLATAFIKFSMGDVINSLKVAMKTFTVKIEPAEALIGRMVELAKLAKKEGLISLEKETMESEFARKALRYLADGFDGKLIAEMLDKDIQLTLKRHSIGQNLFKGMGASAPAFGMIGTLIGLVQMMANMSDPKMIGPSMAVALLTTLYGALVANLVCLPMADKLSLRSQQELETKRIIREGALGINQGMTPVVLEESLKIYLKPNNGKQGSEEKTVEGEEE